MRTALIALASVAAVANAHFTLDSPTSFGFDEEKEDQIPCGGFTIEGATRSPWYYKGGPVQIDSHHDTATVNIRISYAANPAQASDFTALPPLKENLALKGEGEFCFNVDASRSIPAGQSSVGAGQNATLLVEFISTVHGALYQCAAVTFVESQAEGAGANLTCTDSLTASAASGDDHDHDEGDHDHGSTNSTSTSTAAPVGGSSTTTTVSPNTGAAVQRVSVVGGAVSTAAAALLLSLGAAGMTVLL
ncbi:hypothetical protein V8E36_004884 [Tilletia maclaganii]